MKWYLWALAIYLFMALFTFIFFKRFDGVKTGIKYGDKKERKRQIRDLVIMTFLQPLGFGIIIYAYIHVYIIEPITKKLKRE